MLGHSRARRARRAGLALAGVAAWGAIGVVGPGAASAAGPGAGSAVADPGVGSAAADPGAAPASSITVTVTTAAPEQALPVDLSISGTNATANSQDVEALVRPAGGHACLGSYAEDMSSFASVNTPIVAPGSQTAPAGTFAVSANFRPPSPGAYQVCAWIDGSQNGSQPLAGPATVAFTAAPPQASQLTVSLPKGLQPNQPFEVGYTTQTDQPLDLLSIIRAGTAPCASSYEADRAQHPSDRAVLTGATVFGGPRSTAVTSRQSAGTYVICTWIEGPDAAEVEASVTTPVTIGSTPGLVLTKATASRRRGVTVAGRAVKLFEGRVRVTASCGRSSATGSAPASGGSFSGHVRLPAGCRRAARVRVSLAFGGNPDWLPQSISANPRIRS